MTKAEYLKETLEEIAPELNFNVIDPLVDQIEEEVESHVDSYFLAADPTVELVTTGEGEDEEVNVVMECETEGATIYYTTNGEEPTTNDSIYLAPIPYNGVDELTYKGLPRLVGMRILA